MYRTMRFLCVGGFLLILCFFVNVSLCKSSKTFSSYNDACDKIILHAKKASQYYNNGRLESAMKEKENAKFAFRTARSLNAEHPQAYLNMANFLLNTNELEESIKYWDIVTEMVGEDENLRRYVNSRKTRARFGLFSSRRDESYNEEKNLTNALFWNSKQLEVLPNHPEVHFDRALLKIMLNMSSEDVEMSLRKSHDISLRGWISDRRASGYKCVESKSNIIYDWRLYTGRALSVLNHTVSYSEKEEEEDESYVAMLRKVEIVGQDGVITQSNRKTETCEIFLPSANIYHNLPRNLPMRMVWINNEEEIPDHDLPMHDYTKGESPNFARNSVVTRRTLDRAASVVQYASMSYYHWVMEGLGRLLLLLPYLKKDKTLSIILPNSQEVRTHFIVQYVKLVAPFLFTPQNESRIVWYDSSSLAPIDVRVRVKKLYYANWNSSSVMKRSRIAHCLTPGHVLRHIRSSLVVKKNIQDRNLIVFCLRTNVSMRKFQDTKTRLLEQLREMKMESVFELVLFEGKKDVRDQVDIFSRAAIVVGVHGGSLSNIVFCAPETIVFEIGFQTPQTDHYAHAARELNLEYYRLEALTDNDFSVSSEYVHISNESSDFVLERIQKEIILRRHHISVGLQKSNDEPMII